MYKDEKGVVAILKQKELEWKEIGFLAQSLSLFHLCKICFQFAKYDGLVADKLTPSTFQSDIAQLLNNKHLSDVAFQVENEIIFSHKAILAIQCPFFKSMFLSGWKEMKESVILLKEIPAAALKTILEYLVSFFEIF